MSRGLGPFMLPLPTLVLFLIQGCAPPCPGADPKALEQWEKHRSQLEGVRYQEESADFRDANRFFREVCGVAVRYNEDYGGFLSYQGTEEDLRRIDSWFEENCSLLEWDGSEQAVRVRE